MHRCASCPGAVFLEMGKTRHPCGERGVRAARRRAVSRVRPEAAAGIDRVGELLQELGGLLREGVVQPLPFTAYDMRHAASAFRFMAQAKHVGKIVLQAPRSLSPDKAALITGGTGELGAELAQHLVSAHGVKHLVLTSRRGRDAPGAELLVERLRELGAEEACRCSRAT